MSFSVVRSFLQTRNNIVVFGSVFRCVAVDVISLQLSKKMELKFTIMETEFYSKRFPHEIFLLFFRIKKHKIL